MQPYTGRLENVCLDVVEMKTAHIGDEIRRLTDAVLLLYDVPESKVVRYVIDNGSNVKNGYKANCLTLTMPDVTDENDFDEIMATIGDANLEESYDGR